MADLRCTFVLLTREGAPVDAFRRDRCAYQQVIASESDHLIFSLFFHVIYSCPS